jgi:THO complex subunit 3
LQRLSLTRFLQVSDLSSSLPLDAPTDLSSLVSRELLGHHKKVHSVHWNCTGKYLASGSVDQTARIWNIETHVHGRETVLKGHSDSVDQLRWHPSSASELATASSDKTVRFWDARAGKLTHSVTTAGENINIAWNNDGTQVAVGNKEDLISFIDTRTYKLLGKTKFPYEVNEIAWNSSGKLFFVTTGAGTVEVSSYPENKPLRTLRGHTAAVYCLAFSDRYLACGSADALVSLWSLDELVCLKTFTSLEWPVRTLSFSHCGTYLAAASEDLVIDIANVETGERALAIQCNFAMNSLSWNPKKLLLAYAGNTTHPVLCCFTQLANRAHTYTHTGDEKDRSGSHDAGAVHVWGFAKPK